MAYYTKMRPYWITTSGMDTAKGMGMGSMYSQNHAGFNLYRLELVHNLGLPPTSALVVRHYHKSLHFSQHIHVHVHVVLYYYTMWLLALLLCIHMYCIVASIPGLRAGQMSYMELLCGKRESLGTMLLYCTWLTLVGMYMCIHTFHFTRHKCNVWYYQ